MNVLLVNSAAPALWGGGEKWFVEAAEWLRGQGAQVTIVARPASQLLHRAQSKTIATIAFGFGGDFDPLAMLRAKKVVRETGADVVVTNFNKESWQFGIAGKLVGVPVLARHGFTLWTNKPHHRWLAARILTGVVVNAQSIADHYARHNIVPQRLDVVANGVKIAAHKPGRLRAELGLSQDALLLVAAGRLEAQKRFDKLLRCAAELRQHLPFTLAIFGVGPHDSELRAQCEVLQIGDLVKWRGFDEELADKVGDADLFLLTSDSEGTPNAALEAMAAGVPVLGFDVGNMAEILNGELSTFLIPAGRDELFVERLLSVCTNRAALRTVRQAFRERATNKYSFERSMQRYWRILQETTERA